MEIATKIAEPADICRWTLRYDDSLKVKRRIIRFLTLLIPIANMRRRIRRRLLDRERDVALEVAVPHVRKNFEEHVRRCREKLARGEKLKVCFLVSDASMFSAEAICLKMFWHEKFDPFIAVAPRVSRGKTFLRNTLEKTVSELCRKYGNVVEALYDPMSGKKGSLEGRADIVFTSIVYDDQTFYDYTAEPLSRFALTVYMPYGYSGMIANDERRLIHLPQFALFWKAFVSTPRVCSQWGELNPLLKYNLSYGGYPKMDRLATAKMRTKRLKTVLICPHHTLARDTGSLAISNFLKYADFFLKLPTLFPDVHFVFRPHPLLFPRLAMNDWWGKKKTAKYRADMEALPNVEFQEGGDYIETFANSDAMIHDCGSFLAEYFYTGRPQCYLLENREVLEREFTVMGREMISQIDTAYDEQDILRFMREIVVDGKDVRREVRRRYAGENVCLGYPYAAEGVIRDVLEALS